MRCWILVAFLSLSAASARADGSGKILVLDLGGSGVASDLARSLSDVLVTALRDQVVGHAEVVSQADIKAMISVEKQKDLMGCDSSACFAEIGGALGAERIVAGSLGRVGALYVVTIRLIDAGKGQVLNHVQDNVEGKEDILVEAVSQLARSLMDPARPYGIGYVQLREPGVLAIDGKGARRAPFDREPVSQGTHELELKDPSGSSVWKQAIKIPPYQVTLLQAPVGPAWYTRWWLWTGVVVVAGGAVAGYMLTRPGPTPPPPASGGVTVSIHP